MKAFFGIFFACYAIFFTVGFFSGRTAAKSMDAREYFTSEIEIMDLKGKYYLYYADEKGDTTRYSIDDNKVIDPALWVVEKSGANWSFSESGSAVVATGAIGTGTGIIASNYKDIIKMWQKKSANKGRGWFAAIAGAIVGYYSGLEIGKNSYKPEDFTAASANLLVDTTFWKEVEKKAYVSLIGQRKADLLVHIATTLNPQWSEERTKAIDSLSALTLTARPSGFLTSGDFLLLNGVSGSGIMNIQEGASDDLWQDLLKWFGFGLFAIGGIILLYRFFNFLKETFSSPPPKKKKIKVATTEEKEMD